ncbi:hypothetical protein [Nocardioides sp. SYSU DS0651]|uniref:hypothetical protein n=1 Tax=Nocardioides sp. SYSU DS0651 TaxID=3415955 RepID=UPI003F4C0A5B
MRLRRTWPAVLLILAPVLAACGDDGADDPEDEETSSAPYSEPTEESTSPSAEVTTSETTSSPSAAPGKLPAACDIVTAEDVSQAYHLEFGPPSVGGGSTTEQGVEWSSDNCGFEVEEVVEVKVKLTGPDDFASGSFQCPQPTDVAAIVEPVQDLAGADSAWWKTSEAPPLEATLRACAEDVLLEIDLEYETDYEGDPRNDSIALAEKLLAEIAG